MKKTMPKKTVEVCDFCQREGCLETCHVCGREYCLTCNGIVTASWGFLTLCRKCAGRDDVQAICDRYAEQLTPVFKRRTAALKRLGRKRAQVK